MAHRFDLYDGVPSDPSTHLHSTPTSTPSAGGPVDGFSGGDYGESGTDGPPNAHPRAVFRMDTGGSFSAGDDLATDGSGRAVAASSGDVVVARALESSSGAGDTAWCTWAGQRIA